MAKKKFTKGNTNNATVKNADKKVTKFSFDMELLTNKYADYYKSTNAKTAELGLQESDESNSNFVWYDTREVFYPVYKSKVLYQISKSRPLHPIIARMLEIVKYLQTLKNVSVYEKLHKITQLDDEIYQSILGELLVGGLLSDENGDLKLSNKGAEVLKNHKEVVKENTSAFVLIDGVFGRILGVAKKANELYCENKPSENGIELKPKFSARARTEGLFEEFSDGKTLHQVLAEGLRGLDIAEDGSECEICEISEVNDTRKFFERYFCLFYKNAQDEERVLVINERYDIDNGATALFDKLLSEQSFVEYATNDNKNTAIKENREKFNQMNKDKIQEIISLDLSKERTIENQEHPKFFKYALQNAKKRVCVHSPWVRGRVLEIYKDYIETALKRGVELWLKYNMTPRNERDKPDIDNAAKQFCERLKRDYKNFHLYKDNEHKDGDHSKILICDEEFMIMGSFNWQSYDGKDDRVEKSRLVINDKESIFKEIREFKTQA